MGIKREKKGQTGTKPSFFFQKRDKKGTKKVQKKDKKSIPGLFCPGIFLNYESDVSAEKGIKSMPGGGGMALYITCYMFLGRKEKTCGTGVLRYVFK